MPSYMTKPKNINSGVPPLLNGFVCTYHPTAPCSSPKDTIYAKNEYELSLPYHYALVCQKLSNIRKLKQLLPRIDSLNVIWQWLNIQGQEGVDRRFHRQKVILATTTKSNFSHNDTKAKLLRPHATNWLVQSNHVAYFDHSGCRNFWRPNFKCQSSTSTYTSSSCQW